MINQSLINPQSIVVIGGSDNIKKPGGKVLKNIIDGGFAGKLLVVNQKESSVQGLTCLPSVDEIDDVDMAIISIPAMFCPQVVHTMATSKGTRAIIILSAGLVDAGAGVTLWVR